MGDFVRSFVNIFLMFVCYIKKCQKIVFRWYKKSWKSYWMIFLNFI